MSNKTHVVQHRSKRDGANSKELSDIKRENNALKRQIARLQKQLRKVLDANQVVAEASPVIKGEMQTSGNTSLCPQCHSHNLSHVSLPNSTLIACKQCNYRQSIKKKTNG